MRRWLVDLANGRDESNITPDCPAKSISTERTLESDTRDREALMQHLLAQSQEVSRQLRRQGLLARTISLKLKDKDFKQLTRSLTLNRPSQSSATLFRTVAGLLAHQALDKAIRLIGIGASALIADTMPQQACLFPEVDHNESGWEKVDRAVDRIAERFGHSAVHRAALSPPDDLTVD